MDNYALITGAADRIGKYFAIALAEMGYNIFLHYHLSSQNAHETARLIEETGQNCILKQADFRREEEVQALIRECKKAGTLEILINNASNFIESSIKTEGTALLDDLFRTNFKAPYILTKQFAKHCKKGLIINMLDTKVSQNFTEHLDYVLTKKSLENLTYLSATQLAPDIRVNGIAPGLILAPEGKSEDYLQQMSKGIPLQQTGTLEQLQKALQFFIGNTFITGEVIYVDGGEHL